MRRSRYTHFHAGAIAVALLLALLPAAALAQVSDAAIDVAVVDGQNLALPGVTVQATNAATGLNRVAVTAGDGTARLAALPPGTYTVKFELDGFATLEQDNVVLLVGQTSRLVAEMKPAVTEEQITVTAAAPVVDIARMDTSTNIVPEQIAELPTPDRDFQKLAFITPGVQRERGTYRFINNAPVLGSGGNASQSTIMVDGVDFTDQALGMARARFSQDAIREFRVITNRFDTEIGQSQGGAMSVVTKSGGNEMQGSAFMFYRGDALRNQGALETGTQDFTRYQGGVTLGGAIARDKSHYFLSLEYINEDNITLFRPGGAFASQAADLSHPFNQTLMLGSLDLQPSDSQTLTLKVVGDIYREENFRVGGVADESSGMQLNRDNYNLAAGHTWVIGADKLNSLHLQVGQKKFDEPNNSALATEYFSFGTTLITGANITGDQTMTGKYYGLNDTFHLYFGGEKGSHDVKLGGSVQWIEEDWDYPVFPHGLLFWATDARAWAARYDYGAGEPRVVLDTMLVGAFVQDDWRIGRNFTLSAGLRWDYDSDGNNPDFTHPVEPEKRSVDTDNFQPRLSFSWDLGGEGRSVLHGGAGIFTGRYLLVPSFVEQQQNGITGRTLYTRYDGLFLCVSLGIPPAYCPFPRLNPADPEHTGYLLPANIALLQPSLEAPEATQANLGFSQRLGNTGLVLGVEGVWVDGDNELFLRDVNWSGNATHTRPNKSYAMINEYTNEGHSKYTSVMVSLNGTVGAGHLIAASVTYNDKKNISDDFSPPANEMPSDPADVEGEYGQARSMERWRMVLSGVFRLPWELSVAPIFEYGAGQPWTRRIGYDYNGDSRYSDRAAGVERNAENGPAYKNFNLRLTKSFHLGGGSIDVIAECFNLFNTVNYDVNSVDSAQYTTGPTVTNAALPYKANPNFGRYTMTLPPREVQLGLRYRF